MSQHTEYIVEHIFFFTQFYSNISGTGATPRRCSIVRTKKHFDEGFLDGDDSMRQTNIQIDTVYWFIKNYLQL